MESLVVSDLTVVRLRATLLLVQLSGFNLASQEECAMRVRISPVLALVLLTCGPTWAQEAYTVAAKPFAAPEIVKLGVELPDRTVKITALLGQMARFNDDDLRLGLTPIREDDVLSLKVFEIRRVDAGDGKLYETIKWLETVDIIDQRAFLESGLPIHLLGTAALKPEEKGLLLSKAKPSRCCLTCGSTTSYGCAVEDTCGSCCVDPCCGEF